MRILQALLKKIVKAPTLAHKNGHAYASFSKLQYWAHPDMCRSQFNDSMRTCSPESQAKQRLLMAAYFGAGFAAERSPATSA